MSRDPIDALAEHVTQHPQVMDYCVAFSGGMDSHVLLHAAAELLGGLDDVSLRAVHINHGLHPDSARWAAHAAMVCDTLDVPLVIRNVSVPDDSGDGPEAAARMARYEAFAELLSPGEHLLVAQHAEDQAETFLLQALRGSGPDGLASIPRKRVFADGYMVRPLLTCKRSDLRRYAKRETLEWIDDPSNEETQFDRNFLRHEVFPLLASRWPSFVDTLSRSAARSSAASQTLLGLAQEDLERVRVRGASELSVSELKTLPRERAYNVLRLWVRQRRLRMPRLQDLAEVICSLVRAREDSAGLVNVRDYEFRRYRDRLYLLTEMKQATPFNYEWPAPFDDLEIAELDLVLTRATCVEQGIRLPEQGVMTVKTRSGGELIKLGEPAFHKAVKKLLQESAVPPWQRDRIPLLYVDGRLAAVWNIAVAVDFRDGAVRHNAEIAIDAQLA